MLAALDPAPPSRRARLAKRVALIAALAMVAITLAWIVPLAVDDPPSARAWHYEYVERDGDFVAFTAVAGGGPGAHAYVRYTVNATPDHILLVRQGDLPALLAGEEFESIAEFSVEPPRFPGRARGALSFAVPEARCPPPTGQCLQEDVPFLVWLRGDAWQGTPRESATPGVVDHPNLGAVGWEGPLGFGLSIVGSRVHGGLWWAVPGAAAAGVVSLVAVGIWAAAERRLARDAAPSAPVKPPEGASVESMLGFVRLASLYVEGVARYFVLSAFVIGLSALAYFAFALPALVEIAKRQFEFGDAAPAAALFVFVPLVALAVALAFWGIAYARVRRELARWRGLADRFDEDAGRILGV